MKFTQPRILLRLEGLAVLTFCSVTYGGDGFHWWRFFLVFFVPDLLIAGYALGPKVGAHLYNAGHTYFGPFLLWTLAFVGHWGAAWPYLLIWAAHIGFDRLLGFGLKYETGFKDTHLGKV
jgi:Domain of unknown function (DUF4260)